MKNISKKNWVLYIVTFLVIVIGDQLTKILVSSSMMLGQSQAIIDNFFYYTYSHNQGAAWGMLSGHISLFVVVSLAAAIFMFYYFSKTTKAQRLTRYGIVLTFAGLVGNLTDRLYFGYVRDFSFIIFGYDFSIFNIADMAVVWGKLIILQIIFEIVLMEEKN
ncbi:MAG: signal peptidase II [Faecalibacillus sp.]